MVESELFGGFFRLGLLGLGRFPAQADAGDLDARQLSTVSDGPVITFAAAILERGDFLVLALLDDFTRNSRAFDERAAVRQLVAVAMEQNIAERCFLAGFSVKKIDVDDVALSDAMLSAACFDNCVSHTRNTSGGKPRKFTRIRRHDKRKSNVE